MARERTLEELAEDLAWLTKQVQKCRNDIANAPYVRHDVYASDVRLHNAELSHVRSELAGLRTLLMWTLGILALMFASGVTVVIGAIAKGGFG